MPRPSNMWGRSSYRKSTKRCTSAFELLTTNLLDLCLSWEKEAVVGRGWKVAAGKQEIMMAVCVCVWYSLNLLQLLRQLFHVSSDFSTHPFSVDTCLIWRKPSYRHLRPLLVEACVRGVGRVLPAASWVSDPNVNSTRNWWRTVIQIVWAYFMQISWATWDVSGQLIY